MELEKFGLYTLVINIIISLFLLSTELSLIYYLVTMVSNIIALGMNTYIIKHSKKSLVNIFALVGNILLPNIITWWYFI